MEAALHLSGAGVHQEDDQQRCLPAPICVAGPLHHGEPHLLPMEEHKRRAVLHMVNRARKPIQEFIEAINEVADDLEAAYDNDLDDKWRGANKDRFVEMMVTDGCFLLELMFGALARGNYMRPTTLSSARTAFLVYGQSCGMTWSRWKTNCL